MWKKVLGWVLFFGGIFFGAATIIPELLNPFLRLPSKFGSPSIDSIELAFSVTITAALIWGGWKLAHWRLVRRNK